MKQAENLARRFEQLKTRVGGNREKKRFEFTFGTPAEEQMGITPPSRWAARILSEIHFALEMSHWQGRKCDGPIGEALSVLEDCMDREGALTNSACMEAEDKLLPLQDAAKEYALIYVSHAHIDMNWMWGMQETVAAALSTFRSVLHMMEEYPEFTFMQSQASVYKIVEDFDPGLMPEIKARIAEGRWEVTANAWVETDKNMPSTESLLHHVEVTRRYLEKVWGIDTDKVQVDFSPDTFGHSRFIPEISRFAGIKYYYHCRGTKEDETLFRYRGPSGAEILTYKEPYWYNSGVCPDNGIGLPQLAAKCQGLKTGLIVYGVGNHGGGPTRRDIERVIEMKDWPVFPAVRFGTLHEFFRIAEALADRFPVIDHELNPIFPGCYTTQSRIKMANRRSETSLSDAAQMCALGHFAARTEYPHARLDTAWQKVLFTHFHDILTGSCVQESREYAMALYADALSATQTALGNALRVISERVDTSAFMTGEDISQSQAEGAGVGAGVWFGIGHSMGRTLSHYAGVPNPERGAGKTRVYTVFNTAAEDREEAAEITLWDYTGDLGRLEAVDFQGRSLPLQLAPGMPKRYWDHWYASVYVRVAVPALGYAVIAIREKPLDRYPVYQLNDVRVEEEMGPCVLENEFLRARFDSVTGALVSLMDKETGQEQLAAPACLCVADTEQGTSDAWHIGRYVGIKPVERTVRFRPVKGDVRSCLEMEQKILSSTVITRVSLDAGAKALQYAWEIDWQEAAGKADTVPVLVFRAPLKEKAGECLCDVPGGFIRRAAAWRDIPCLTFASAQNGGCALTLAADSKYGYRLAEGVLSCTLINSAGNPDPYPERGLHRITLWLHIGNEKPAALLRRVGALNRPLIALSTKAQPGELPPEMRLMQFRADSAVLSGVELTEDGALRVRAVETGGKEDTVTLTLPFAVQSARLSDMKGNQTGEAKAEGRTVTFDLGPWRIQEALILPK
ncbi:MAG: alpha-mannosidase [Clostridia bacterium]|nr:alpha-mannosidase [Clostridia bacterium]